MPSVLAIDLGGTKTAIAHVDQDGKIVDRGTLPAAPSFDASIDQIVTAGDGASAVGLIVPGIYTPSTGRAWCPNL